MFEILVARIKEAQRYLDAFQMSDKNTVLCN